ncbi:MogA/MoaB family molybdenum cofactor biosynthesis protein [Aquibacillus sediminis]|uniref:MogA/MoaB family molybdenum cofactor biosynthesis protein n=1 Tax=Aquibacillus sediminis TaxID=2574734 RepID=UPI00110935F4|nr:MogA/MoaB family molybdenum cofactor biosynthesis protein [Aquibacillus sediminis]
MSVTLHKKENNKVHCKVITISDTRTEETDKSGQLMMDKLAKDGHEVVSYQLVADDQEQITEAILAGCSDPQVQAILLNGGTGISKRDITIETIKPMLDKELVGFGEIFRSLSYYEDIGSAAILSRAIAGVMKGRAVFATPGSSGAVKLALERLILPELSHVITEVNK